MANESQTSDDHDHDRDYVKSLLEAWGFQPDMIAETIHHKTPDMSLPLSTGRAIIEVKSKDDDRQLRSVIDSEPGTTHVYTNTSIESKLRRGLKQIRNFPAKSHDDFSLIWLLACKSEITTLTRPAVMTLLYGIQNIDGSMVNTHEVYEKECFFFGHSFFFRYKDLNAVVLQDFQDSTLCINTFSARYRVFARTNFVRVFREQASVIDPEVMESSGECFLADCNYPRKEVNSVVQYLKDKYGLDRVRITQFYLVNHPVDDEG